VSVDGGWLKPDMSPRNLDDRGLRPRDGSGLQRRARDMSGFSGVLSKREGGAESVDSGMSSSFFLFEQLQMQDFFLL